MKIFNDRHNLQKEIINNKGISFIPTMGGLHKGHISLINKSKKYKLKTIVSIFVNPKQFNKKSDFISYPRNKKNDIKTLKKLKVDYLYLPTFKDIYEFKTKNRVFLDKVSKQLCGKYRKNHFKGVLNVVNRFIEIIKPKYIFMGKKDYQQLYLIKRHISKNKMKSEVIECNTVREKNGVACSSRNSRLDQKGMKIASNIYHYIFKFKKKIKRKFNINNIIHLKKKIIEMGANKIDYLEIYDIKKFKKSNKINKDNNLFIAYYIKNVRLIDNI